MYIDTRIVTRPGVGWANECEKCHGEGYVQVGSTVEPEENELELCTECDGVGAVDRFQDVADNYEGSVTEF